jgi:hypothetical protein
MFDKVFFGVETLRSKVILTTSFKNPENTQTLKISREDKMKKRCEWVGSDPLHRVS